MNMMDGNRVSDVYHTGEVLSVDTAKERSGEADSSLPAHHAVLRGIATLAEACTFLDVSFESLLVFPSSSLLPRSRKCTDACVEILPAKQDGILPAPLELKADGEYSVVNPYQADVIEANWLTKHKFDSVGVEDWGEERVAIRLELSTAGSGIQYQPGDYISISSPNPSSLVAVAIERVQMASSFSGELSGASCIRKAGEILTIQELFEYRYLQCEIIL